MCIMFLNYLLANFMDAKYSEYIVSTQVNSLFGKTMENVRKRTSCVLIDSDRGHKWQTSKPGEIQMRLLRSD